MKRLALLAALLATPATAFAQASPSAYTSAVRYDAEGQVTGTISADPDALGSGLPFLAVRNSYDGAGRLTKVETGTLSTWQSEAVAPSAWGSAFTVSRTLETQYDALGHKLRDTLREGAAGTIRTISQYSYDSVGRLECTAVRMNPAVFGSLPSSACTLGTEGSDGPDRITKTVYDAAGERVQLREGVGTAIEAAEATWAYNDGGQIVTVIDGNGNRASLHFDGFGRQDSWVLPSLTAPTGYNDATQATALATAGSVNTSDHEDYSYDANGNRTDLRKRDGRHIVYAYDALNRITSKTYPQGGATPVYFGYDNRNLQTFARFDSISGAGVANSFDGFGRLASASADMAGTTRTLTYGYDRDGDRTWLGHPDGTAFASYYDNLDRLIMTMSGASAYIYTVFRPDGSRQAIGTPSASAGFDYDGVGRPSAMMDDFAGSSADASWSYTRDAAGGIRAVNRDNDAFAWRGAYTVNRAYATNGLNQYTTAGGASFAYDADGNLISDGTTTYAYDIENRLISASGGHNATLTYDPLGRLSQVTSGSSTTRFLYDGDALIAEYNGSGTMTARHLHATGADVPMVTFVGSDLSNPRFHYPNHQGSIIASSDSAGTAVVIDTYDEYGIPGAGNTGRFQYTGQIFLAELGLYYYKARFYTPTLGRFMQTDPVGYQDQFNLYAYVGDDPINHTDPSGKECNDAGTECWADTYHAEIARIDVRHAASTDGVVRAHSGDFQNPVRRDVRSGALTEPRGVIVRNANGSETLRLNRSSGRETGTGDSARQQIPSNATGLPHGHLGQPDGSRTVVDTPGENRGWGDTQSLGLEHPIPTYTIAGDRIGVHDAPNGRLHFEMLNGTMTREERRQIQDNLNTEQLTLEESLRRRRR